MEGMTGSSHEPLDRYEQGWPAWNRSITSVARIPDAPRPVSEGVKTSTPAATAARPGASAWSTVAPASAPSPSARAPSRNTPTCKRPFSERKGTVPEHARLPDEEALAVLNHLREGCGTRATGRLV